MPSKTNQTPTKKSKRTPEQKRWIRKRLIIISLCILIPILILDLLPTGGNMRLWAKWIECGQKPVAEDVGLGVVPSYEEPESFLLMRLSQPDYYCTPLEAEKAGLSANEDYYEYPHLDKLKQ